MAREMNTGPVEFRWEKCQGERLEISMWNYFKVKIDDANKEEKQLKIALRETRIEEMFKLNVGNTSTLTKEKIFAYLKSLIANAVKAYGLRNGTLDHLKARLDTRSICNLLKRILKPFYHLISDLSKVALIQFKGGDNLNKQ